MKEDTGGNGSDSESPDENLRAMRRLTIQLIVAILLSMSGITLLFSGFWIDPQGLIDNSVLVAFGEISTFAGALFGGGLLL